MEFSELIQTTIADIQDLYLQDSIPWILGCSWGKDSTTVVQLVWQAVAQLPPEKHKPVHIITTDTRIEQPQLQVHVARQMQQLETGVKKHNLPFSCHLLMPEIKNSFWVKIIGHGYAKPANHGKYRWCTSRLKIDPAEKFIKEHISQYGESYTVLGVRTDESITRARSIAKHSENALRPNLNLNSRLPNNYIYTPITAWSTQDIWMYLLQVQNPWGANNQELFQLYRGATADSECPLVVETGTQSCGKSRFGCWSCTVARNASMEAMIDNSDRHEWMQPLLDFRNELAEPNDRHRRDYRYAFKHKVYELNVNSNTNVLPQPGRYTKQWRELWLIKLLEAEKEARSLAPVEYRDLELISIEELSEIRRVWLEEFHYFDDRLPEIYREATGKTFADPRKGVKFQNYISSDAYATLEEICESSEDLALVTSLLATEKKFQASCRRQGIYQELEKCLRQHGYSKEEKIISAYEESLYKQAVEAGIAYEPLKPSATTVMQFSHLCSPLNLPAKLDFQN